MKDKTPARNTTIEVILPLAIIILAISSILEFMLAGAGTIFYVLFLVTMVVVVFTWYKMSGLATSAPAPGAARPKARASPRRKR